MSRHIITEDQFKYVFGWDQPLQSFYFQKHDLTRDEDEQIIIWLGADHDTTMYEVEDLVREAKKHGLWFDNYMRGKLFEEKDGGI